MLRALFMPRSFPAAHAAHLAHTALCASASSPVYSARCRKSPAGRDQRPRAMLCTLLQASARSAARCRRCVCLTNALPRWQSCSSVACTWTRRRGRRPGERGAGGGIHLSGLFAVISRRYWACPPYCGRVGASQFGRDGCVPSWFGNHCGNQEAQGQRVLMGALGAVFGSSSCLLPLLSGTL